MSFVHELEQFIDDSLEKLPVGAQKAGVLSDHVHYIGRYHRLVVFAALMLAHSQQICKFFRSSFSAASRKTVRPVENYERFAEECYRVGKGGYFRSKTSDSFFAKYFH